MLSLYKWFDQYVYKLKVILIGEIKNEGKRWEKCKIKRQKLI